MIRNLLLTAAAGAGLALAAAPASAQSYYGYGDAGSYQGDYNRGYRDRGDFNRGGGRNYAVNQCTRAATDAASRRSGSARVTEIRSVDFTGDGFRVNGVVASYQRGWGGASYQRTGFTCRTDHGRIADFRMRQEYANHRNF